MVATVTSLTSAAVTTRYFERDGYYAKADPEHRKASRWHGRGAAALGLGRNVAPSRFEAILAGAVPGTEITLGRIRDGKREHRPGLDVTLQAPKSVSLAALVAGDARIVRAHDEAVRATLDFVEGNLLVVRQWDRERNRHVRVPSPSMVAATFRHKANRNLEPHLHTHAVIANMTRRRDGSWASLDTGALGRSEKLIGAHYRNELAARLLRLGYALRPSMVGRVPGFEIAGYGRRLLEENSSRRQEIVAWVQERGLANTAANRQRAALATRKTKDEPHHRELEAGWRARAKEMGLDRNPPRPEAGRRRAAKEAGRQPTMLEIVNRSAEHLAERASVFREADLCTLALARSPGLHTHADYRAALDGMKRDGHLVDAIRGGLGPCLVTRRALRAEREVVERMRAARETGGPLADAGRVERAIATGTLTEGQREAVRTILLGEGRIAGVQGYAGTGKTAMLRAVRELAGNRRVIALAPSAAAVRSLRREAGLPARTLQGFLSRYRDVADGTVSEQGLARLKELHSGSVLVLDEASMAGTVQMRSLMRIADALDVGRLVLVGDTRQLRAIEAGQPFRQLQEAGMPTAVMDDVLRQRTPHLREAVAHVIGGRPREALGRLGDDVHEVGAGELGRTAARLWLDLDPSARAATAILAPTHEIRAEIAATVREGLASEGVLRGKEIEVRRLVSRGLTRPQTGDVRNWEEGDAAVFHHDLWGGKAKAGEVFTVDAVDEERAKLVHDDGRTLKVKPGGKLLRYQLELHETTTIRLRAGDEICWTRNDKVHDLVNGERARVLSVDANAARFRTADGRGLKLSRDDPQIRHLDHAYSATVHGAQGTTADRVIAVLDSGHGALADQATFYVEVTRARDEAVILTDNREQLAETLEERTGLRMTALEAVGERVAERETAPEPAPKIQIPDKAPVLPIARALESLRAETRASDGSILDAPGFKDLAERLDRERRLAGLPKDERKALDGWRTEIDRETARRDAVTRYPERCRETVKALLAPEPERGPDDAVRKVADGLVAEGRAVLADPAAAPHLDSHEGMRESFKAGLAAVDGAVADSDAESALAEWEAIEAQAALDGTDPFRSEEGEELIGRIEALAGDGRVPESRREALGRILEARDRVRDLDALEGACRGLRSRAERGGGNVAVRPGAGALLERIGAFADRHPGPLPETLAGFAGECGARMRDLGDRLDTVGAGIMRAAQERDEALAGIEKEWKSRRAKVAHQDRDIAFLPGTEALLWRTREFEERHPGVLPKATADLARDCESVQDRWKRFGHAVKEIADCAETSEPPGPATCRAMAFAEEILADDRLSARILRTGHLLTVKDLLADLNGRRAAEDRILDLRKDLENIEAEAERQGCHPFHVAGHRRFVERLAGFQHDLPPDLAGMVEELPGLEARDRGIRHRVKEVTDFEARRRRIIERAAWLRPEAPLGRSMASSYGRWKMSAPKVIERGETLARDPLVSPEDRKALERALARMKAAPDADGLDAQRVRTWERILDKAEEQGCHRYFVKGYHGFVTELERSPVHSLKNTHFGIDERTVWHEMLGRQGRVRHVDKELARLVERRKAGGEKFVSEIQPYARWRHEVERRVEDTREVLADPETYGPHIARVPGLEKRLREVSAAVSETVARDAPVRKEVEAAHAIQMEREREIRQRERDLERSRSPSRSMGAEIDYGR
ncbi:MAG: relaxase domain-containing protein [Boseongicola sp.]|nr:relaxase domain-containing protein [Boseongicola sp.]